MERIILSSKYADELRAYSKEVLSSVDAQCERHLASWNTLDVVKRSELHVDVCRVQLSQNLGTTLQTLRWHNADLATLFRSNGWSPDGRSRTCH